MFYVDKQRGYPYHRSATHRLSKLPHTTTNHWQPRHFCLPPIPAVGSSMHLPLPSMSLYINAMTTHGLARSWPPSLFESLRRTTGYIGNIPCGGHLKHYEGEFPLREPPAETKLHCLCISPMQPCTNVDFGVSVSKSYSTQKFHHSAAGLQSF